jgi:RNA polymerase sigma-70 factor (ECF subfamily)
VYRIARSAIADHRRAAARRPQSEGPVPDPAEDDDDRAAERALAGHVAAFVARLPSPYREALTLTELEGLTQKDTADMLGVSLSGMKSRVQRGRRHLREALEQCCHVALDAQRRVIAFEPRPARERPDGCCSDS